MKITNNTTSIKNLCGEIILFPGANPSVDPKAWARVKTNPLVKAMVASGKLETDETSYENLAGLSAKKALDLIKETAIVDDLERWLVTERTAKETRKDVIAALNAQLDALRPPKGK